MTARTPPVSTARMEPLASYCVQPTLCKEPCPSCEHNRWIDSQTCRWCSALHLRSEEGHLVAEIGRFCGNPTDSVCRWLFMEYLARINGA